MSNGTILIVDDVPEILENLAEFLEGEGYNCLTAFNGNEAVNIFERQANHIDLVILDWDMPGMNGDETLVTLRQIKSDVMVVMLTAYGDKSKMTKSIQLGARGYIHKPISDDGAELLSKIKDLLQLQRMIKQEHNAKMGKLASGIAHYMKNALWNIKGRTQMLLEDERITTDVDIANSLQTIERIVDESSNVLFGLLHFAGKTPEKFILKDVPLLSIIQRVGNLLEPERKRKNLQIKIDTSSIENLILPADERQLENAIFNVFQNAIEAASNGGEIKVDTKVDKTAKKVSITIADNGDGMDGVMLGQVKQFNAFFTNKTNGIGLGLHVVKSIIDKHEGIIKIESEKDRGTIVTLTLNLKK